MRRSCVSLLFVCLSCGGAVPPPSRAFDAGQISSRLTLPPDELTRVTWEMLENEVRGGNGAARVIRALYLIDLFDYARFAHDPLSRKFLFEALQGSFAAPPGEIATEWATERLLQELGKVQTSSFPIEKARILIGLEAARTRDEALARLAGVRAIARDPSSPLRANALLRLYGHCMRAFRDAVLAPRRERAHIVNVCLYALYESDPSAYFSDNPEERPPDPPWTAFREALKDLLKEIARTRSRLSALVPKLTEADDRFFAEVAPKKLPPPLDVAKLTLPEVSEAAAWDRTPLVMVGDKEFWVESHPTHEETQLRSALAALRAEDPRRSVTVIMPAQGSAYRLARLALAARAAGMRTLELGVAQPLTLRVPPTDYWAGKRVVRLATIPISLAPLDPGSEKHQREAPKAERWDPTRDELGLVLSLESMWVLCGRDGLIARLPKDPKLLRETLVRVRRAFPDQTALGISLHENTTYAELVEAVQAARFGERGAPLMQGLGLVLRAPTPHGSMETRILRRSSVTVKLLFEKSTTIPQGVSALETQMRECFLGAADRTPRHACSLTFAMSSTGVRPVAPPTGILPCKDPHVRSCISNRAQQAILLLSPEEAASGIILRVEGKWGYPDSP